MTVVAGQPSNQTITLCLVLLHFSMPHVLIASQQATCRDVTGHTATFELPLSICIVMGIGALRAYKEVVCWAMERHSLVKLMLIIIGKFCAVPFVVHGKAWDSSAGEFPAPVRVLIVVGVFYFLNRSTTGTEHVKISLILVIPICRCVHVN